MTLKGVIKMDKKEYIANQLKEDRERFSDEEWIREIRIAQEIDGIELL